MFIPQRKRLLCWNSRARRVIMYKSEVLCVSCDIPRVFAYYPSLVSCRLRFAPRVRGSFSLRSTRLRAWWTLQSKTAITFCSEPALVLSTVLSRRAATRPRYSSFADAMLLGIISSVGVSSVAYSPVQSRGLFLNYLDVVACSEFC